ncbi:MAG: DUF2306 domain-containing protein [Rudaea sp.]|nr:DUF2306 domain-containing protein [Rudaea sp.]
MSASSTTAAIAAGQPQGALGTSRSDADRGRTAGRLLRYAAGFWFCVAALGQLIFAAYVAGFYGRAAAQGRPELWNKVLLHGYVAGEPGLNLVLGMHLLFAVVITIGGLLQLIPPLRRRLPAFHRWTGRAYLVAAVIMSVSGLVVIWMRGTVGDFASHVIISFNALLILTCATVAWRRARAHRFDLHRQWALRLFLAVSGVWFFRVGLMFWIVVNQGPVGFDPDSFIGPALTVLGLVAYFLPQGVVELYLRAQQSRSPSAKVVMAGGLTALSLMMAVGIAAATAIMWLPRL